MKIGILTFVNTTNYGAALQAYALQRIIKLNGCDCDIINYYSDKVTEGHDPKAVFMSKKKRLFTALITYYVYKRRKEKFIEFEEKFCTFSEPCDKTNISLILEKYDKIVVGSDQVWNVDITGQDKVFFLSFLKNNKKKYSYAASVGKRYFSDDKYVYEKLVNNFINISVREQETAELLSDSLRRKDITCDVDPTLLLMDEWTDLIENKKFASKYIFMYLVPESDELLRAIKSYAKYNKLKIIWLRKGAGIRTGFKIVNIASPIDFITYIANAEYVITGSFHALCFSLMLNVKFYVTESIQKERSGRLANILNIVGLTDRVLQEPNYQFTEAKIDFDIVREKINICRDRSLKTIALISK